MTQGSAGTVVPLTGMRRALREMAAHLQRLRTKGSSFFGDGDPGAIDRRLSFYVHVLPKATDSERCTVFVYDPERERTWSKAGLSVAEHQIEVSKDSVVGRVVATGEPIVAYDLDAQAGPHHRVDAETGFETKSILCVPIRSSAREEITGAIEILNKRTGKFTDEDVALAQQAADHLQREVDQAFLEQEIFGVTEVLFSTARKATTWLLVGVSGLVLIALLGLAAWALLPALFG